MYLTIPSTKQAVKDYIVPANIALIVAGYPIPASLTLLAGVDSQVLTVPFRALVLFLGILIIVKLRKEILSGPNWFILGLIAFWALYSVRLFVDVVGDPSPNLRLRPYEYLLLTYGVTLPSCLSLLVPLDRNVLRRALTATFWVAATATTLGAYTLYSVGYGLASLDAGRLGTEALNATTVSLTGAILVALSFAILTARKAAPRAMSVIAGIALLPGFFSLYLGASRGPAISLLLVLLVIGAIVMGRGRSLRVAAGVLAAAFAAYLIIDAAESEGGVLTTRLGLMLALEDQSDNVRMAQWSAAWDMFLAQPLTGAALEENFAGYYPHNIVLEAFMSTGIVGGLLVAAFVALAVYSAFRLTWAQPESSWFSSLCLLAISAGLTAGGIFAFPLFWCTGVGVIATYARAASGRWDSGAKAPGGVRGNES